MMLKYPVTIVLLLLTSVQTFSKWCLIAEFRINKDYIEKIYVSTDSNRAVVARVSVT